MKDRMFRRPTRRRFLTLGAAAGLVPAWPFACSSQSSGTAWNRLRLVDGIGTVLSRATLTDVSALLGRALKNEVSFHEFDNLLDHNDLLLVSNATPNLDPSWRCVSANPGAYRFHAPPSQIPGFVICGSDPEGARNGVYAWLESSGFGFFRDSETVPRLPRMIPDQAFQEREVVPAFRWRGDMVWDNYLGPRRYCASAWNIDDWESALLYLARNGLNFLEFYPPMETIFQRVFPNAEGLAQGAVWTAEAKENLAHQVLLRGRELGIHFMYVVTYGAFPSQVRDLYPNLEWRNGFLCAHQPELPSFTGQVWQELITTFDTDHLYAIRHRGEEGQSYSDPCQSVTKAQGFNQALRVLKDIDPNATPTVWTWAEAPDLFDAFPASVRAAHIRHGMGGMFDAIGAGREQSDGRPALPSTQPWLSGQFTVFSGADTLLQTAWSDGRSLARDARAAASDKQCEGYFQWPEWSNTSPWLSEVIRQLAWNPSDFVQDVVLARYAAVRHGSAADAFLAGFRPLLNAGNARFMATPRKRLLVPYFLNPNEHALLSDVRAGLAEMGRGQSQARKPALFARDLTDLLAWTGVRQVHVFEAAAYRAHGADNTREKLSCLNAAEATWGALFQALTLFPELSLVDTARHIKATAIVSDRAVDSFWTLSCDFYNGYPLVLSPEAIELVYLEQTKALRDLLSQSNDPDPLSAPSWFWHDFPDQASAKRVRELPRENAQRFEAEMRNRFSAALTGQEVITGAETNGANLALSNSRMTATLSAAIEAIVNLNLPDPLAQPDA